MRTGDASAPQRVRSSPARALRVLVVDDDESLIALAHRVLVPAGYEVSSVADRAAALTRVSDIDLIIVDAVTPQVDGIALLRSVREKHEELPVILAAASATAESAGAAARYRASDYLVKPISDDVLLGATKRALQRDRLAGLRRETTHMRRKPTTELTREQVLLEIRFSRAMAALHIVYQPIVSWSERAVFGYEALVRSSEASLLHPGAIFDAAERLKRVPELGRRIRAICAEPLPRAPAQAALFVNLHASDLLDETLFDAASALAQLAPRVVLEITERSALHDLDEVRQRLSRLRALGFRIAIDDIGAGYSGLNSLATLAPDLVKLDLTLVRGIDMDSTRQRVVRSLTQLCSELGIAVIAEGVETVAERDALLGYGIDLLQGYLFARPGAPFPEPVF